MEEETVSTEIAQSTFRQSSLGDMMLAFEELGPVGGLERFAASLDPEWIEEALVATGTASIRRRKLPAQQVVWLVLGMCLFTDRSIVDMVAHLGLVMPTANSLARSAVSAARSRLGSEPIMWLFEK